MLPAQKGVEAHEAGKQVQNDTIIMGLLIAVIAVIVIGFVIALVRMTSRRH